MDAAVEQTRDFAIDIAREAGRLLMGKLPLGRWRGSGVEHKEGRELVSHVDRASEALLVQRIADAYPDHAILAEEQGSSGGPDGPGAQSSCKTAQAASHRWIIDPLDGTTNFLHGHPMFCVSLALEQRTGEAAELVVAVVHLPYLGDTFFAARGMGAHLNTTAIPLRVSTTSRLDEALVATGFAYDRERHPNYDNFVRLARDSRGIRRCGSAAIDLAFVAAGRYDAFWELGLRAWDVAAGALLVREAGGEVSDFEGAEGWLEGGRIIASNGQLSQAVSERLDRPPRNRIVR